MCLNQWMELTLPPSPTLSPAVREALLEFVLLRTTNPHTRRLYLSALRRYADWLLSRNLALVDARPMHLALYAEGLSKELAPASIAAELSGIRRLYAWLVERQILAASPAVHCRGPRRVVTSGKTPVLGKDEIAALFESLADNRPVDRRDRAVLHLMLYAFLRVGAVTALTSADGLAALSTGALLVREKGGQQRRVPLHPQALQSLAHHLADAPFRRDPEHPLFPSALRGRSGSLGHRAMSRTEVYAMVRRRLRAAGITTVAGCHAFRATGITEFLACGGRIETAALLAGHASLRTTQLYDRRPRDAAAAELAVLCFEREKGG